MQKVFREELDQKHAEHIAFRREQQAWRSERAGLDMAAMVCTIKHGRYSVLCRNCGIGRQTDRQTVAQSDGTCIMHVVVSLALCLRRCPLQVLQKQVELLNVEATEATAAKEEAQARLVELQTANRAAAADVRARLAAAYQGTDEWRDKVCCAQVVQPSGAAK